MRAAGARENLAPYGLLFVALAVVAAASALRTIPLSRSSGLPSIGLDANGGLVWSARKGSGLETPEGWRGLLLGRRLDPSTATAVDWDALPGIGPETAERIVKAREEQGPEFGLTGLAKVKGLKGKRLEAIEEWIRR